MLSSPLQRPLSFQDWKTDEFHVIPFLRLFSQMECALWVVRRLEEFARVTLREVSRWDPRGKHA